MNNRHASTSPKGERRTILVQYLLIGIVGYILGTLSGQGRSSVEKIATSRMMEDSNEVDTEETEDHASSSETNVSTVTCIVLLLIVLTIVFEFSKEHLEERATRNLRPLVDKLFGEMTVLGFLSVVTFCITQAGWFTVLSEKLFGEDNELLEIFEFVHFTIFFIMISFVLQVLVLVAAAMETEQEWVDMDQAARDNENDIHDDDEHHPTSAPHQRTRGEELSQNCGPRIRPFGDFVGLLPCFRNRTAQRKEDFLLFQALRHEFLLERSPHYPFHPAPAENRIVDDFNFGRYLGINQGSLLAHVVEVSIMTWTFFGFLTVLHFFYVIAVNGDVTTLAWSWVAVGWIVYAFHVYFERHLIQVRRMFLRKELYLSTKVDITKENDVSLQSSLETTYLNSIVGSSNNVDNQTLPEWSDIDIDQYHENRSWLARVLAGRGETNRQHAIYWLDRRGPWLYLHILQANLLFLGIYAAMNFLSFFQHMYHTSTSFLVFLTYILLAGFPFLSILLTKKHTVAVLSQVCCMGAHRRPNVVDRVLREDKTARAVGTFLILMRASSGGGKGKVATSRSSGRGQQQQHQRQGSISAGVRSLSEAERREVAKAFDTLDHEGCGTIARKEFERLMRHLGSGVSDEGLAQLVKRLDEDGSGGVSKEEFIQWYAENAGDDNLSEMERAHLLFGIFDSDNTGDITIAEFKDKLDSLKVGFTVDEIGAIVNELDEDNSGTISQHEFAHLLHKYHPKALQSLH